MLNYAQKSEYTEWGRDVSEMGAGDADSDYRGNLTASVTALLLFKVWSTHEKSLINLGGRHKGLFNIIPSNTAITSHMWLIHFRFKFIEIWWNLKFSFSVL